MRQVATLVLGTQEQRETEIGQGIQKTKGKTTARAGVATWLCSPLTQSQIMAWATTGNSPLVVLQTQSTACNSFPWLTHALPLGCSAARLLHLGPAHALLLHPCFGAQLPQHSLPATSAAQRSTAMLLHDKIRRTNTIKNTRKALLDQTHGSSSPAARPPAVASQRSPFVGG